MTTMDPEDNGGTGTTGAKTDNNQEPVPVVSNSDIKKSPLFQKLAEENARLKAAEEKRKQDEAAAATEAERKKLEGKQRYEEALATQKSDYETRIAKLELQNTEKDLTNELLRAGFKNSVFNAGAIKGFDPKKSTVEEYVKALTEDEANKIFLDSAKAALQKRGDVPTPTASTRQMSPAELKAALHDKDPKIRATAREQAKRNWLKTGSTGVGGEQKGK
jgi:hypothetical protein